MNYVPRFLADALRRAATTFPVVMVTGARQTGKTTLLRHEFGGSHRYVSLDRPDVRLRAQSDPVSFLAENPPPVILDEVQHVPELLPYIKSMVDEDRRPGVWILTGSQGFGLMKGVSESLAGRVAVLTLDPLAVGEGRTPSPIPSMDQLLERVFGGAGGPPGTGTPGTGAQSPKHSPLLDPRRIDLVPRKSTLHQHPASCPAGQAFRIFAFDHRSRYVYAEIRQTFHTRLNALGTGFRGVGAQLQQGGIVERKAVTE